MAPQQLRISFDDAVGWLVAGAEPGPAGVVSLMLDDLRITVDAARTDVLVEMAVFADAADEPVPAAALDVCGRLFGPEFATTVSACPHGAGPAAATAAPTALWQQVARAAAAEFLCAHDRRAPRLAALRLVGVGQSLIPAGAGDLVRERAWQALPALIAAGGTAARHPELVDRLPARDRSELAAALGALEATLVEDGWNQTRGPLRDLADLLAPMPSDSEIALLTAGSDAEAKAGAIPRFRELGEETGLELDWTAASDALRLRLGEFAAQAFAGARATGEVPGEVDVRLQLRDTAANDAPAITVRVQEWNGQILGESPLRIQAPPGRLPRGECSLTVSAPGDADLARRHGVYVDIAVAGLAPLDAAGLRRAARSLARRSGVDALLARHAGDEAREREQWQRCAGLYAVAGDSARAAAAEEEAAVPARERGGTGPVPARDWTPRLLSHWLAITDELAAEATTAPAQGRFDDLRRTVQDLSFAADGAPEAATAHERLAAALLKSDRREDRSEAIEHLHEALRLHYLAGDPQGAARVLRLLGDVASPAGESAQDDDGHEE